jgi:hypothetical protein
MPTKDLTKKHFFYPSTIIACGGSIEDLDQDLGLYDPTRSPGMYTKRFDQVLTMYRSEITCPDCERAIIANAADCLSCRDFVMTRRDTSNHTCDPVLGIKRES